MQAKNHRCPILCIGGLDPSGGAGLQADIESIAACGGHALPIATCLTIQNTSIAEGMTPVEPDLILNQADRLLSDMTISGCKIGVIPNAAAVLAIADIISRAPDVPIVLDPVLCASSGMKFNDIETIEAIKKYLLPNLSVITPNHNELIELTQCDLDTEAQCKLLCESGPDYVLLTGGDCDTSTVNNLLFSSKGQVHKYTWQRLPNSYHGSGCTLSSAITINLALGLDIHTAVEKAQQFTWQALKRAEAIGAGQWIPNRIKNTD